MIGLNWMDGFLFRCNNICFWNVIKEKAKLCVFLAFELWLCSRRVGCLFHSSQHKCPTPSTLSFHHTYTPFPFSFHPILSPLFQKLQRYLWLFVKMLHINYISSLSTFHIVFDGHIRVPIEYGVSYHFYSKETSFKI